MEEIKIKVDLHEKIDHADTNQLKKLYILITNYFNANEPAEEWELLPEYQKQSINKGLEQADTGWGTPLTEVNQRLRDKCGLNDLGSYFNIGCGKQV